MNFSNMKVASRLGYGFALVIALFSAANLIGLLRLSGFNDNVKQLSDDRVPKLIAANSWIIRVLETAEHTRNMLIMDNEDGVQKEIDAVKANQKLGKDYFEQLQAAAVSEDEKELLKKISAARSAYAPHEESFLKLILAKDTLTAKDTLLINARPAQLQYIGTIQKFIEYEKGSIEETKAATEGDYKSSRLVLISFGALAALIGASIAWFIASSLLKQLGGEPAYAADVAAQIARGDLSTEIDTKNSGENSLMIAMKSMRESLARIVGEVRSGTNMIATATSEISSGIHDLSARTESQASALEETASSMEELTSTVKLNADNARHANQLALSASAVALKGGEVVSQVVETMSSINQSSSKIVDIIGVIDGIAFQTNILALNAAVEAARAGEQGRGFAVVATEVRTLAQRSASAAKEIKTLISDSVDKVNAGTKLVDHAGVTMDEIVKSIRHVTDIVVEISAASEEQTAGIEQINHAIMQMDNVTQQNAALVEQSAAASQSLQSQAEALMRVVSAFKLDGRDVTTMVENVKESTNSGHSPKLAFQS